MSPLRSPHLPPSSPETVMSPSYYRIRMFVSMVVIALLAGIAGALVVVGWIFPSNYLSEGILIRGQQGLSASFYSEPEQSVIRKIKNSSVEVFRADAFFENGYYTKDAIVGSGVMLTSNGWGVVYAPQFTKMNVVPQLKVRDVQNVVYTPTTLVPDKSTGFVYFKLSGNEFYVGSFPDWRTLAPGLEVFVYMDGVWRKESIGDLIQIQDTPIFAAAEQRMQYTLVPDMVSEGIVITDSGNILGFIDESRRLIDAWSIASHSIPGLTESGVVPVAKIEWRGRMVETVEAGKIIRGFMIESAGKNSGDIIKSDIIRAINGTPVNEFELYRMVRETPLTVTVWRSGNIFDILIP